MKRKPAILTVSRSRVGFLVKYPAVPDVKYRPLAGVKFDADASSEMK